MIFLSGIPMMLPDEMCVQCLYVELLTLYHVVLSSGGRGGVIEHFKAAWSHIARSRSHPALTWQRAQLPGWYILSRQCRVKQSDSSQRITHGAGSLKTEWQQKTLTDARSGRRWGGQHSVCDLWEVYRGARDTCFQIFDLPLLFGEFLSK